MEWMDWVERFGGWGVVILVVRWMMTRMDRMIDNFEEALEKFGKHEVEETVNRSQVRHDFSHLHEDHKEILDKLEEVHGDVKEIRA